MPNMTRTEFVNKTTSSGWEERREAWGAKTLLPASPLAQPVEVILFSAIVTHTASLRYLRDKYPVVTMQAYIPGRANHGLP